MKIGIAVYNIAPRAAGGVTSYTLSLIKGFMAADSVNDYLIITNGRDREFFSALAASAKNFTVRELRSLSDGLFRRLLLASRNRLLIRPGLRNFYGAFDALIQAGTIKEIDSLGLDILYVPSTILSPLGLQTNAVVSLHDIQHVHFPEFFSPAERRRRAAAYSETVRQAARIQASSAFMRRDFINYFHCPEEKVIVIGDGVDQIFRETFSPETLAETRQKYSLPEQFVFYPAQHWPHKNHIVLLEAVRQLRDKGVVVPLVLTGSERSGSKPLHQFVATNRFEKQVQFIGNVNFSDLPKIYRSATMLAMPSLHESNSLPIMEAMVSGCPVIASDIPPNVELNGGDALVLFKRNDTADLAEKILSLWRDREARRCRGTLGQAASADFSWEKTAHRYLAVFKSIAQNHD
ncbi:glycosyltransferase family 4 protein [Patescibacteria group bacterium]|nr:glycosyltransferase family 4 protein [Patescibacteria group bacterium]